MSSNRAENYAKASSFLDGAKTVWHPEGVETRDQARDRLERERRIRQRLRTAAERLNTAEWDRAVAISAAHRQGLSVRQIAAAVHLSSARVHQLLHAPASATSKPTATLLESGLIAPLDKSVVPLATIAALLRECTDWLERLDRGELVTVNLRDTNDLATEYVPVDRAQVRQLMRRLARDLEDLAVGNGTPTEGPTFARREHLADLVPTPPRLSPYEERLQLSPPTRARPLKLSRKLDALA